LCRGGRFGPFYKATQLILWIAGLAILLVGFLAIRPLMTTILPARYAPAIAIVRVLLPAGIAGFLIFPLTLHFLMFYAPRTFLALDALSLPLVVPAYVYAAQRYGAIGVAWVSAFSTVIKAVLAQVIAVRLVGTVDGNVDGPTARQPAASRFADIGVAVEG
jgi:O-antigen/teichoic acid export membrane protein